MASFNKYRHLSSNLEPCRCGYVKDDFMTGRVTVFRNGKLISVGTESPDQAKKEPTRHVKFCKNTGLQNPQKSRRR